MDTTSETPRLYVLPGGHMDLAERWIRQGGGEDEVRVPMPSFLFVAEDRVALIDTGCAPEVAEDPKAAWGRVAHHYRPDIPEEDLLERRLRDVGFEVSDVTDVILTHLHMDHAGGTKLFRSAQIWVQRSEYRWALEPDPYASAGFFKSDFDHDYLDYQLLDGDQKVMNRVFVLSTRGHTPGHQSVLIRLDSGWHCVVGDAVYNERLLDGRRMPGIYWNAERTLVSASRLALLRDAFGVKLLFSHDADQYETLPKPPEYLT